MAGKDGKHSEKKEWAKLLFIKEKMTQVEIATKVGVRPATISAWVQKHQWEKLRTSLMVTRHEQLSMLYAQLNDLNRAIIERPEGERYAQGKDADVISKLTAAIRSLEMETSIANAIDVFMKFTEFARKVVPHDKVKDLVELQDAFIKSML